MSDEAGPTRDIAQLIKSLTLDEKASLLSGRDFWNTKSLERHGIGSWMMTDGPHGLRKQSTSSETAALQSSVPATCFPSGAGLAATWNRELLREVGSAIGAEAKRAGVGVVLGPAVNIKRSPLCGRNFEYFSEDPFLSGELAKGFIAGLQSRGVGASLKHFAANNQETRRLYIDARVDERTLREIYFPAFEMAVMGGQPWTVMCSYNRVNGTFASEHDWLINQVLRKEWGFRGFVVTDWGACKDRVKGLEAGIDLEMPGSWGTTDKEIKEAVQSGLLAEAILDAAVARVLEVTFRVAGAAPMEDAGDAQANHRLARRCAAESFVLLKNENDILPIIGDKKIALIGRFVESPRYQGGGSSRIEPKKLDDLRDELKRLRPNCGFEYSPGYSLSGDIVDPALIEQARRSAASCDAALVFVGLPPRGESEGFDRRHLRMPENHTALIEAVLAVQPDAVIILSNGGPVEMPWASQARVILETYLGGEAWGGAVADIVFGLVSPSGKLAESFPKRLQDTPSYLNFPGDARRVEYREGLFVGYRHYDSVNLETLFPFGHGLTYSRFEYSNLRLDKTSLPDTDTLEVTVDIENAGTRDASEIVQLYVHDLESSVIKPIHELKGFEKVFLRVGEKKTIRFRLGKRAFAYWSVEHGDWVVESGDYELEIGSSSKDIRQRTRVEVLSSSRDIRVWDIDASIGELAASEEGREFARSLWPRALALFGDCDPESPEALMFQAMARDMPLRNLARMGDTISLSELGEELAAINGRAK